MGEGQSWGWAWRGLSPEVGAAQREGRGVGKQTEGFRGALKIKLETGSFQNVEKPLEGVEQGSYMICLSLKPPLPKPTPFHTKSSTSGLRLASQLWSQDGRRTLTSVCLRMFT